MHDRRRAGSGSGGGSGGGILGNTSGGSPRGRMGSHDGVKDLGAIVWRFVRSNPIYVAVIFYALVVSVAHLRSAGKARGPYVWQVHGASPTQQKGSCFCGAKDDYCLCTPSLAIDCILEYHETKEGPVTGLVFVQRKDGKGAAVVGGFVEIGETVEEAVAREVQEETGAAVENLRLLGIYSHPERDDRRHTVSATFVGSVYGKVRAGDDAKEVVVVPAGKLDIDGIRLAFDHVSFLQDYYKHAHGDGFRPQPREGTSLCYVEPRSEVGGGGK